MQRSYQLTSAERATLSERELTQLTARARVRHFTDGQFIWQQGDPGDSFWAVTAGHVTIGRFAPDGALTVFAILGPRDMFGELAYFSGLPRQVSAMARGPASLVMIDRPLVRQLMAADVGWAELLLRSLARQLAAALNIIDGERRLTTAQRLLDMLRAITVEGKDGYEVRATQQDLADLLGVSRVTLGAALAELEAAGQIERGYGRIRLIGA